MISRLSRSFSLLLVALLVVTTPLFALAADATTTTVAAVVGGIDDAYRISAPDIYPNDAVDYVGDVLVKLVANSPDCDLYYTRDGTVPTAKSTYYATPFPIFTPGRWTIRAIAVPRSGTMYESVIKERFYSVLPAKIPAPLVEPLRGVYRGIVSVRLAVAEGSPAGAKVQYAVDITDPENVWQTFDANQPIVLDTPGEHFVVARTVVGDGKTSDTKSPTARFRFTVTPALTYDVGSECVKCEKKPTVGHPFTIYLQNPEPDSLLFLTTSRMGCANEKHMVDDTAIQRVAIRQAAYRFVTYTDAEPRVFVCLKEPSTAAEGFKIVPRRIKSGVEGSVTDGSFAIEMAIGGFQKDTDAVPTAPVYHKPQTYQSKGNQAGSTFPLIAFLILFVSVGGAAYTVTKFATTRNQFQRRAAVPNSAQLDRIEMGAAGEVSGTAGAEEGGGGGGGAPAAGGKADGKKAAPAGGGKGRGRATK